MENYTINEYIASLLKQGRTREEIYKELLNQGQSIDAIQSAFNSLSVEQEKQGFQQRTIKLIVGFAVLLIGAGIFSFISANQFTGITT